MHDHLVSEELRRIPPKAASLRLDVELNLIAMWKGRSGDKSSTDLYKWVRESVDRHPGLCSTTPLR